MANADYCWMEVSPGSVQMRSSKYDPTKPGCRSHQGLAVRTSRVGLRRPVVGFGVSRRTPESGCTRRAVSLRWEEAVDVGGIGMVTLT